jgi:hypothetical protein
MCYNKKIGRIVIADTPYFFIVFYSQRLPPAHQTGSV